MTAFEVTRLSPKYAVKRVKNGYEKEKFFPVTLLRSCFSSIDWYYATVEQFKDGFDKVEDAAKVVERLLEFWEEKERKRIEAEKKEFKFDGYIHITRKTDEETKF